MSDTFPMLSSEPETRDYLVRFVGGSAAITEVYGNGVTAAFTATGRVTFTWADNPGVFVGALFSFQATTHADVKSYVAVAGVYSASARTLEIRLYESGTLTDLAALEWCTMRATFSEG